MPENPVVERVRSLVQSFLETDLVRLRIERDGGHVELRRRASARTAAPQKEEPAASVPAAPAAALAISRASSAIAASTCGAGNPPMRSGTGAGICSGSRLSWVGCTVVLLAR